MSEYISATAASGGREVGGRLRVAALYLLSNALRVASERKLVTGSGLPTLQLSYSKPVS